MVVKAGASKLKSKTVEAVVDHITQTLPKADGEYCEPLTQHYFQALSAVFEPKANVERLKAATWSEVVDFCLRGISQYSDDGNGEASGLPHRPHRSPGTESSHVPRLLGKSINTHGRGHSKASLVSRQSIEDLLDTLLSLVSAPNAPLLQSSEEITTRVIQFLHSQGSAVSMLHQLAFSILNAVLSFIREDRSSLLQSAAEEVIPLISRFWQGKNLAKDEMLNSVRDEMLIFLFTVNLHLERSIMDHESIDLASKIEDLLDVMRAEYSRRLDRDPLHMEDLDMVDIGAATADATPFRLDVFQLRPHNGRAERNWANLQIIGLLERLVNLAEEQKRLPGNLVGNDEDKHPRKRQRTTQGSDRLLRSIKAHDDQIRLGAMQTLPFILQNCELSTSVLVELLGQLTTCAAEKEGRIASWALLAIAR
jgi:ataxia telangiectasia mutated family protein